MVHDGHLDDAAPSARWYTKRRVEISNVYIEPMEQTSHEEGKEPMEERENWPVRNGGDSPVSHMPPLLEAGPARVSVFGFPRNVRKTCYPFLFFSFCISSCSFS